MKKSRFTEEQILIALKQAEAGRAIGGCLKAVRISEATFRAWKKPYANLGVSEVWELRQVRDENSRLKRPVADLTLDRHVLPEVSEKRFSGAPTPGDGAMGSKVSID
jgi:putative transposase